MEKLSKSYFSQIYPNSTISIEAKPKSGKQGSHIFIIQYEETTTNKTIKVNILKIKRLKIKVFQSKSYIERR
jgi:hypothetical protein